MLRLSDYNGNPYVGVYCAANESIAFVPKDAEGSLLSDIEQVLGVRVERAIIGGTNLLGSLISMNSHGAVVTNMASSGEVEALSRFVPVYRIEDRINASGNNILVNDNAALANPDLGRETLRAIAETLQVETVPGAIAGHKTVGSACAATNRGLLCHPSTTEEELAMLETLFKVPAAIGTLNYGAPLVGACLVANSRGAVVGSRSTPIELGRAEDALALI
jgi:translation initiation factor 6